MKRFRDTKYLVTRDGNDWSEIHNRFLKQTTENGYMILNLRIDSKTYKKYVHRMVAEVYIPNPDNKPEVNHKNGIKADCSVKNLEWNTRSENMQHAYKNGLINNTGEFNGKSKLTETDILEIYKLKDSGLKQKEIGERFPISITQVRRIVNGDKWSHLYKKHYGLKA